jgi:hypothetical protein
MLVIIAVSPGMMVTNINTVRVPTTLVW